MAAIVQRFNLRHSKKLVWKFLSGLGSAGLDKRTLYTPRIMGSGQSRSLSFFCPIFCGLSLDMVVSMFTSIAHLQFASG
jgi:hypothetical protein